MILNLVLEDSLASALKAKDRKNTNKADESNVTLLSFDGDCRKLLLLRTQNNYIINKIIY